jgi:pyruvate kinase
MAKAGMDIARINFSHGSYEQHLELIKLVREVNHEHHLNIKLLQDLTGYRIRLGELRRPIELMKHQQVHMCKGETQTDRYIPLHFEGDIRDIKKGMEVFIADGMIELVVVASSRKHLLLEVVSGGRISSRKNVNIPQMKLKEDILTEQDKTDIEFGIEHNFDYIAQSFVRTKSDILSVVNRVKPYLPKCQIIAKIESQEGVRNLDSIAVACDGILIARGDLGVSLPIYQIPVIQKEITRRCNQTSKTVITATQMLESMTTNPRPTRAEVSDVANAILDGSDYVMLSGETAIGNFPVKCVRMMENIITYTERHRAKLG